MSKGRRPKKDNRPSVTTRDAGKGNGSSGAENGGGSSTEASEELCWDFTLIEKTAAANSAKEGTTAIGSIQGQRVLVRVNSKPLGYAPYEESKRMIIAARKTGARLSGSVTSVGKKGGEVWINLCLED